MSRHDLSHRLPTSRTSGQSFPEGSDYQSFWVSILTGRIVSCGMHFVSGGRGRGG